MPSRLSLNILLLAGSLLLAACSNDSNQTDIDNSNNADTGQSTDNGSTPGANPDASSELPATTPTDDSMVNVTIERLKIAYMQAENIWPEFNLSDHPSIVIFRDTAKLRTTAVAINFPALAALGETSTIDTRGAPFTAVRITKVTEKLGKQLDAIGNFEFLADVEGTSTFMIAAEPAGSGLDATVADYGYTFGHEVFHRFQFQKFKANEADQNTSTYPFTAENISLAMLEERALKAALETADQPERKVAARHYAGIRMSRLATEPRVALDNSQETYEGTARYIEHHMAGNDTTAFNHLGSFAENLDTSVDGIDKIKEHFGFDRFYASGAAATEVIQKLGINEFQNSITNGLEPATLLARHFKLKAVDATQLVTAARAAYDTDNELPELGKQAAERALTEKTISRMLMIQQITGIRSEI